MSSSVSSPTTATSSIAPSQSNGLKIVAGIGAGLLLLGASRHFYQLRRPKWRGAAQRLIQTRFNQPTPASASSSSSSSSSSPSIPQSQSPFGIYIVTGSSCGLGRSIALALYRSTPSHVILAVRNVAAGHEAKEWIKKRAGDESSSSSNDAASDSSTRTDRLHVCELVVGDLACVAKFVSELRTFQTLVQQPILGVINNAGVLMNEHVVDPMTGWETTVGTNHLGLAQFTEAMISMITGEGNKNMEYSQQSDLAGRPYRCRIVNVGSRLEATAKNSQLNDPFFLSTSYKPFRAYSWSKRCMMAWSYERYRRLQSEGVPIDIVSVTPGMVSTNLFRGGSTWTKLGSAIFSLLSCRPADLAAETVLHACFTELEGDQPAPAAAAGSSSSSSSSASTPSPSMSYFGECRRIESSDGSKDRRFQAEVYSWTTDELERVRCKLMQEFRQIKERLDRHREQQQQQQQQQQSSSSSSSSLASSDVIRVYRQPLGSSSSPCHAPHHAFLAYRSRVYRCAIGRSGMVASSAKKEGDGCTPIATLRVRGAFYRADVAERTRPMAEATTTTTSSTCLPIWSVRRDHIWADGETREGYNTFGTLLSSPAALPPSFEYLHRSTPVYDTAFILGWNDAPVVIGGGSAIFFHIARLDSNGGNGGGGELQPTEGCIGLKDTDMDEVAAFVNADTIVRIAEREEDTLDRSGVGVGTSNTSVNAPNSLQTHYADAITTIRPSPSSTTTTLTPPPNVQFAAAADRNKGHIADVLAQFLHSYKAAPSSSSSPSSSSPSIVGHLLELSSGTGQHVAHFGATFPRLQFQPSDQSDEAFESIRYYARELTNVRRPICIDLLKEKEWTIESDYYDYIYVCNMLHISELGTTDGLFRLANRAIKKASSDGKIFVYGPFQWNGEPTTESNRAFDHKLKQMNPSFGLRDVALVNASARANGFVLSDIFDMPSNNFMLIFERENQTRNKSTIPYHRIDQTIQNVNYEEMNNGRRY